jgi:hypothetical protein
VWGITAEAHNWLVDKTRKRDLILIFLVSGFLISDFQFQDINFHNSLNLGTC